MRGKIASKIAIFVALLPFSAHLSAQQAAPFIIDSLNVIHDETGSLNSTFKLLYQQKQRKGTKHIPFLHIGDSHIQAGFLTRIMRTSLQKEFGNAGLGLIVPLKMAGTNQPRDYRITSNGKWESNRMVTKGRGYTFGISGIAIQANDKNISLDVEVRYDSINNISYPFNKITVFHNNAPTLIPSDSSLIENIKTLSPHAHSIFLNKHTHQLNLKQKTSNSTTKTIHAFSIENGNGGVLYHTLGINGARCRDFCSSPLLIAQTRLLNPQVIIISLGTNESIETPCSIKGFLESLDCMVKELKKVNPDAVFILTTPAEGFRRQQRTRIPNERILLVRDAIVEYAALNKLAYWDLFEATGGKGASNKWKQSELLGHDLLHFSIEGYELQGKLFFEAFMKSYYSYVGKHRLE
jgi:lysophospholipase L1-like esterase